MYRLLVGAGLLAIAGFTNAEALAADLTIKGPVAASIPSVNWTGCYVGVHAGAATSSDKIRSSGDFNSTGFIAGGQVGCDYQFESAWLVGIEGRAAWSTLSSRVAGNGNTNPANAGVINIGPGGSAASNSFPTRFTVGNDFLTSVIVRAGYSFAGSWLAYVKGGVAWAEEKADIAYTSPSSVFTVTSPPVGVAVDPKGTMTRTGWTAGAGLEWAFTANWSTRFEYDYYDFGSNDFTLTDPANHVTFTGNLKDHINTVTVGLNYRFR